MNTWMRTESPIAVACCGLRHYHCYVCKNMMKLTNAPRLLYTLHGRPPDQQMVLDDVSDEVLHEGSKKAKVQRKSQVRSWT